MSVDLTRIFEVFGLRKSKESVRVSENPHADESGRRITLTIGDGSPGGERNSVCLSTEEARFVADRLNYLADKVSKKFPQ